MADFYNDYGKPKGVSLPWYEVWRKAVLEPSENTFAELLEDPNANATRAYIWIALVSLLQAFAFFPQIPAYTRQLNSMYSQYEFVPDLTNLGVCMVIAAPFFGVLGIIISTGITQFIARSLGGTGRHEELVYAVASYTAPLALVTSALSLIPTVSCLAGLVSLYSIYLNLLAVRTVNQFSWGNAIMAVIVIPILIVIVLFCLFSTLLGSAIPR